MKREEIEALIKMNLSKDGKTLDLTAMHLKEAGAMDIARCEFLKDITALELGRNLIGPKGAKYVAKSTVLTHLASLNLFYNNLGNEGAKYIAVSDNLLTLVNLNLSDNAIGDEGAKALAKFLPLFGSLTRLDLRLNRIKEEGQTALREAQKMTQIKQLLLDKEEGFQVRTR
jgi:Ran GTPase-activating protein (RanGAP) involved in mRNA processing and transport